MRVNEGGMFVTPGWHTVWDVWSPELWFMGRYRTLAEVARAMMTDTQHVHRVGIYHFVMNCPVLGRYEYIALKRRLWFGRVRPEARPYVAQEQEATSRIRKPSRTMLE